ncbi:MAG: hypothetical protein P8Q36_01280 [Alphaproteobacteria bacterium]|jgi:hypothetical protein|nr:hypothetical protein [Rhodospirillaceae bacterium]MDG2479488.1 hypothetical protein [Alphaproteobacteria bacterium]MBT6202818.1 hypothetical protein [Rhodospirillaceae bacterium]MBT6512969.1 hypothetical protein [Rhodospirillaceae bacterium]MBT7611820.1 hypothetical protein [Rhodospirillaceae bacterium]
MNTILDQGILGHPYSPKAYWASDVSVTPMRSAPPLRSGNLGRSISALWQSLTKG